MISLPTYEGRVLVAGLGKSGLSVARALMSAGNDVIGWDDHASARAHAQAQGIAISKTAQDVTDVSRVILSPGLPLTHPAPHPVVRSAHAETIPIEGDLDLLADAISDLSCTVIAVTGTNGKSTTTALIAHLLHSAGRPVVMGGNIGTPVMDLDIKQGSILVLELSSYQIDLLHRLKVDVAVLTNIGKDHIDRHGSLEGYIKAKIRLLNFVSASGLIVMGVDGDYERELAQVQNLPVVRVATRAQEAELALQDGAMVGLAGAHYPLGNNLPGRHNAQNAGLAIAVAQKFGLADDEIIAGLNSFAGLAHRLETIGYRDNIRFVNDSKATNAEACGHALRAFTNIYWIAGGRPKSDGLQGLEEDFCRVRHAYLIGEAAQDFATFLEPFKLRYEICDDLSNAVHCATRDALAAQQDAVVLLSPACASFDQFTNFEARGDAFRALVTPLVQEEVMS